MENDETLDAIESGELELEDGTIALWDDDLGAFVYTDDNGDEIVVRV